jgi:geranylgeranyl diphosphate synthase type I
MLCSEIFGGKYQDTKDAFIALELIHNGTLIHDDLIDDDDYRRGQTSVHTEYGGKKAILAGDMLLSLSLKYACKTGKISIIEKLSDTAMKMVQGVAAQTQYRGTLISLPRYAELAYLKSGSLFETAASIGGLLSNASGESLTDVSDFGKYFGLAYQVRDDIIDIVSNKDSPTRSDIANGDVSLPLIYALESKSITEADKGRLVSIFEGKTKEYDEDEVLQIFYSTGSLDKSVEEMKRFADLSRQSLGKFSGEAVDVLGELIGLNYSHINISHLKTI